MVSIDIPAVSYNQAIFIEQEECQERTLFIDTIFSPGDNAFGYNLITFGVGIQPTASVCPGLLL